MAIFNRNDSSVKWYTTRLPRVKFPIRLLLFLEKQTGLAKIRVAKLNIKLTW